MIRPAKPENPLEANAAGPNGGKPAGPELGQLPAGPSGKASGRPGDIIAGSPPPAAPSPPPAPPETGASAAPANLGPAAYEAGLSPDSQAGAEGGRAEGFPQTAASWGRQPVAPSPSSQNQGGPHLTAGAASQPPRTPPAQPQSAAPGVSPGPAPPDIESGPGPKPGKPVRQEDQTNQDDPPNALAAKIRIGLGRMILAMKNYALYPEANHIRQQSLLKAQSWLTSYFEEEKEPHIRLQVEKDRLLFNGETVYQDQPDEQPVFFPLFRDGVQWFEFLPGLTLEELQTFINLLNQFRILKEEAEDDLVTAMWDKNFKYIKYDTADGFWEVDPIIDIASLKVAREIIQEEADAPEAGSKDKMAVLSLQALSSDYDQRETGGSGIAVNSIADLFNYFNDSASGNIQDLDADDGAGDSDREAGSGQESPLQAAEAILASQQTSQTIVYPKNNEKKGRLWFTPQEIERLERLIAEEERRDNIQDCLEILLILMNEPKDLPNSGFPVIEFLTEEVKYALSQGGFLYVRTLLEKLRSLSYSEKPWLAPLVNDLYRRISTYEALESLLQVWPYAHTFQERSFTDMRHFLLLLPPESIYALAPILAKTSNRRIDNILIEAIAEKISQIDINTNIELLVSGIRTPLLLQLIGLLKSQQRQPGLARLLLALTRHAAPYVRELAAKALLEENPGHIKRMTHLLNDSHPGVNRLICEHLGRRRSDWAEKTLRDYLYDAYNQQQDNDQDEDHILNCYRAFGRCALPRAIPFLRDVLLKKDWRSFLGLEGYCHRRGAALALLLMPAEWGAAPILKKAAQSSFRNVRLAYEHAVREIEKMPPEEK